jgi:hypothetical protein|tara:strand:- start:2481 stop:2621 length:141 start_codon:yes stop_codon:yes gene_type:complete
METRPHSTLLKEYIETVSSTPYKDLSEKDIADFLEGLHKYLDHTDD